ncbi:hypothetical protein [Clostridium cadaveris]|uniref:hypothetical protein n=1 Tax=Clostridium cadaveris TaxID=1529 RepID=UPI0004273CE7|nr:hypothetical protein [Clostridium cadaveris]
MKNIKKAILIGTMAGVIGVTSITALAATSYNSPAEVVAGLTGRSVESIRDERKETGKTCGTIAKEAGVIEEFKSAKLEVVRERLKEKVSSGSMTQEEADKIVNEIQERQKNCDGSGQREENRMKLGLGNSSKNGNGMRKGQMGKNN